MPSICLTPLLSSAALIPGSARASAGMFSSSIACGSPMTRRAWQAQSAVASGSLNFQSKWLCTISTLCAYHSAERSSCSASLQPTGTGARSLNRISGSIRGDTMPASEISALPFSAWLTVSS